MRGFIAATLGNRLERMEVTESEESDGGSRGHVVLQVNSCTVGRREVDEWEERKQARANGRRIRASDGGEGVPKGGLDWPKMMKVPQKQWKKLDLGLGRGFHRGCTDGCCDQVRLKGGDGDSPEGGRYQVSRFLGERRKVWVHHVE